MAGRTELQWHDGIALLTLHNPGKHNALDPPLLGSLTAHLVQLAKDGARAAVLTGEGTAVFSAMCGIIERGNEGRWRRR